MPFCGQPWFYTLILNQENKKTEGVMTIDLTQLNKDFIIRGKKLSGKQKGRQIKNNDDLLLIVDGNVATGSKEYFGTRYYKANYSTPIKLRNQMKIVLTVDDDFGPHLTKMYFYITGILSDPV